jgi:hypothetical protein
MNWAPLPDPVTAFSVDACSTGPDDSSGGVSRMEGFGVLFEPVLRGFDVLLIVGLLDG